MRTSALVLLAVLSSACGTQERRRPPPQQEAQPARPNHTLSLEIEPWQSGRVLISPAAEACDADCSVDLEEGTAIALSAEAAPDWQFASWSGDCAGTGPTATLTLRADMFCKATFAPAGASLVVAKVGQGHVSSLPAGIDCGGECAHEFGLNRVVILEAHAASDWSFAGWSPPSCSDFTIGADTTCTATFVPQFASRTWGTAGADDAIALLPHPGGGYMLGGHFGGDGGSADTGLSRVDAGGELVWHKSFANPKADRGGVLARAEDGWLIAAGMSHSAGINFWAARVDESGNPLWQKRWERVQHEAVTFATSVSGGWLIGGWADNGSSTSYYPRLMRLDPSGGVLWQKQYDGGHDAQLVEQAVEASDGYLAAGTTADVSAGQRLQGSLVKLDASGNVVWAKTYVGPENAETFRGVVKDGDGYVVAGVTSSWGGNRNALVMKLDSTGAIVWQRSFGGPDEDIANDVTAIPGGGFLVLGTTRSFGAGKLDALALWLWSDGSLAAQKVYGGPEDDVLTTGVPFADGGALVAGRTASFGDLAGDVWTMKLGPWGAQSFSPASGGSAGEGYALEFIPSLTATRVIMTAMTPAITEVVTALSPSAPALTPRAQAP